MSNPIFSAMLNEAAFTKELLGIGVTQIYKANYARKGIYYQSFVCLSTGMERLEKLCLILNHILVNGDMPKEADIRSFQHDIGLLLAKCNEIATCHQISNHIQHYIDDDISQAIISILTEFASSSGRYSNINMLVSSNNYIDCMLKWFVQVDEPIFLRNVSEKKKSRIIEQAEQVSNLTEHFSYINHRGEDSEDIISVFEASVRTGKWKTVAPYRQYYLLRIIKEISQLLIDLGYKVSENRRMEIPYFSEIFGCFTVPENYFMQRKTWDNI